MITLSGRSTAVVLFFTAALLAAMFAFGVFTPQATPGVSAHPCQSPDDTHTDTAATPVPCADRPHATSDNDHEPPKFSMGTYTFQIPENKAGSGGDAKPYSLGQVMATETNGVSFTYELALLNPATDPETAVARPTSETSTFAIYPQGHIAYTGTGLNFEGLPADLNHQSEGTGDSLKRYIPLLVYAYEGADAPSSPLPIASTETVGVAMVKVYVTNIEAGPPTGLMVGPNATDATAIDVSWNKHPNIKESTAATAPLSKAGYAVQYREVGEETWETHGTGSGLATADDLKVFTDAADVLMHPSMTTITGLDAKTDYEIRVQVTDTTDPSEDDIADEWSDSVVGETVSMPSADDKVMISVTSEDQPSGTLMVSWTQEDGSGVVEVGGDSKGGWLVQYGERQTWSTVSDHTLLSRQVMDDSTILTGLDNGTRYYVRVIPVNRIYSQTMAENTENVAETSGFFPSNTASAIPYGGPTAPEELQVVAVNSSTLLANWQPPMDMGGYSSVSYTVSYKEAGSADEAMEMTTGSTSANISGLKADTLYQVEVVATNPKAMSPAAVSFGRTAMGPGVIVAPGLVQDLGLQVISDTELFVSWSQPASDGGSPVTGYSVQYKAIGAADWMTVDRTGADVGQAITGLMPNTNYQVQVAAMNSAGTGAYAQTTGSTNAAPAMVTTLDNKLTSPFEAVSSDTPGDAVRVTLMAKLGVALGGEIEVKLDKFGLPSSIDDAEVTIRSNDGELHYQGNPTSVTISGSTVTLTLGTLKGLTDSSKTLIDLMSGMVTTITIQQSAGITNPTEAKVYDLEVGTDTTTNKATVNRKVTVKPASGARGSEITVSGKGFGAGTATLELGTGDVLASNVAIEDGSFEHTLTVGDAFAAGANAINAVDGAGNRASKDNDADFTVKAKITASPDEAAPTEEVTIKVSDWSAGAVSSVTFGGLKATIVANSNTTSADSDKGQLKITVPANARVGVNKVSLNVGGESKGSVNVSVKTLDLSVDPSEAVPGQRLTITGSGFLKNTDVTSITVGGKAAELPEEDDRASTSSGRIAYTITVPLDVGNGDKKVVVTVGSKQGKGAVAIPKPSITVSPEVSAPGTVISVEGEGFASGKRIEVLYGGEIEEVGRADSSGEFTIRLEVPSGAGIGTTSEVRVEVRGTPGINATADHKTPGSTITLPETAQVGSRITISGTNFAPFTTLRDLTIGGNDALPSPAPETDKNGAFEFEVRVPRIAAGSHTVTVQDNSKARNSATETFTVVTTPIVSTPQEVFGVLGDSLVSVWSLNNATKKWSAYFPGAPAAVSDLTGVKSRDIVWIHVSADVMFQGGMLTTGWNLISLE